jgi:hypothetical protein
MKQKHFNRISIFMATLLTSIANKANLVIFPFLITLASERFENPPK